MVHLSKKASTLEQSPSKMAGSLPLSFVPLFRSSGFPAALGNPPLCVLVSMRVSKHEAKSEVERGGKTEQAKSPSEC